MNNTPQDYENISDHEQFVDMNNHRYISNICRNGPIPLTRHWATDKICTILFLLLFIGTITTFLINYFHYLSYADADRDYDPKDLPLFDTVAFLLWRNNINQLGVTLLIVATAIILILIAIFIPVCVGYLIILISYGLLLGMLYLEIFAHWGTVYTKIDEFKLFNWDDRQITIDLFRIILIVLNVIAIVVLTFLICSRLRKIKHLGSLMKVSGYILKNNSPSLPITMTFVLVAINLGIWTLMSLLVWSSIMMKYEARNFPIPLYVNYICLSVLWVWIHGLQNSISDYICQSWIIHWYYKQIAEKENIIPSKTDWKSHMIHKMFRFHFGTLLAGSFFAYLPQNLIRMLKYIQKNKNSQSLIFRLSRYYQIETIFECLDFTHATHELYYLRKRIKNEIPEIYMLGHFLQDILKLFFIMLSVFAIFYLNFMQEEILTPFKAEITHYEFTLFIIVFSFGLAQEFATNISHLFGMLNDTAIILYSIDCQIERVYYGSNEARAVPSDLEKCFIPLFAKNIKIVSSKEEKNEEKKSQYLGGQIDENMRNRSTVYRYSSLDGRFSGAQANFYEYINNPYKDS